MFKLVLVLTSLVFLSGCGNAFKQYYSPNNFFVENNCEKCEEPAIYVEKEQNEDTLVFMYKKGYSFMGHSTFNGASVSESELKRFAKELGACIVLFSSKYTHTVSGAYAVPQYNPGPTYTVNTNGSVSGYRGYASYNSTSVVQSSGTWSTDYVPYSVARSDYLASFWVKFKQGVVGMGLDRIPDELRRKYDIEKGMIVKAVRDDHPADKAGIMAGDIIVSINGQTPTSDTWQNLFESLRGKEVEISLVRDGKPLSKRVQLNP